MASIMCAINIGEVERKGERQKAANQQARDAGKWRSGGAAVFGYSSTGVVVEHERVLLRAAMTDVLAERSIRSLAKEWNSRGIATRRGGQWSVVGFRYMLINPRYAALMTHRGQIIGKGDWEPIVDADTHYAVAALLKDPARRSQHSFERVYIGSGVYACGVCGTKLRPVSSKPLASGERQASYGCPQCYGVCVKVEMLDAFVQERILALLETSGVIRYVDDDTEDIADIARRRDGLQARLDELGRMFARGEIDGSQLRSGTGELRQQLAGLNAAIAGLLRTSPSANLLDGAGELRDKWAVASAEMRGRILDELVTVTVKPVGQSRGRWGRIEDRVVIEPK
jgi:hypothetical protein